MKALLFQMGLLFGGAVASLSLLINLLRRVDLLTAVFRAGLVFAISLLVSVFFLHFFAIVLHRFVTEEMVRRNTEKQSKGEKPASEEATQETPGAPTVPRLDVPRPNLPPRS